jgi:hypothetical protein
MDTTNWKWFRYDEIFDIKHGFYNKKPEDNPKGDIPFIGATDSNNGVTSHSDLETIAATTKTGEGNNSPMEEKIFENCIAVTNNGSVGYAYYQAKPFTCTHDVNPLYLKGHELNPYIALFLCSLIEKERFRWAYGRKWRPVRMPSSRIKLPVTPEGTPDWKYMEDFIKDQIIPQLPKKAQKVWMQKYDTKPLQPENMKLNTQDWKWFTITDLFRVELTKGDIKADEVDFGEIPLVSSGSTNNGVVKYITAEGDGKAEMFPANTITLDMFCHANYQGTAYYAVGHGRVNILIPKFSLNHYIGIFICSLINQEEYRFSYGRAVYSSVAENIRIKLPVTPEGTPDWQFMENYIKSLPYSKNIEPSQPNEIIDEMMEVKKEIISLRKQLQSQHAAQVVNYGTININDNSKNIKF